MAEGERHATYTRGWPRIVSEDMSEGLVLEVPADFFDGGLQEEVGRDF